MPGPPPPAMHPPRPAAARGRPSLRRTPVLLGVLLPVLGAVLIALGGEPWRLALRYERGAILADGELWRLITGHLVHLNLSHLLLDTVSLALIWALVAGAMSPALWWAALATAALAIDAAFLLLHPELAWYVGLSGVIHGVFLAGAVRTLRQAPGEGTLMLALLAAKLAWEVVVGPMPWSESASRGPVVEEAHLYGSIGGAVAVTAAALAGRLRRSRGARG